ncbi:MAG TPA: zf-HC2 domain-containing protein [Longimicrobiales bacterium]|nr:zf-HC2 domain-containing protein [Longimicrobiales bacterium]
MNTHPRDLLSAYADGELDAAQTAAVAAHLTRCTECAREVALIRSVGGAMRQMINDAPRRGVWDTVHRRITRPVGWTLILAGIAIWAGLLLVEWYRSRALSWEWIGGTAFWVGAVMLVIGVAWEQYRDWQTTRYKDVTR